MYKNIILSPHSDDAAFSLGGLLLSGFFKYTEVLMVFSVSNCTISHIKDHAEVITQIRKNEDRDFFGLCKSKVHLGYLDVPDAPIRLEIESSNVFNRFPSDEDQEICNKISCFIKESYSSDIVIYSPLALGNHIDHLIVFEAACTLASKGYTVIFYEDLPYAANYVDGQIEKKIRSLENSTGKKFFNSIIRTDISITEKVNAINIFKSQIDASIVERITSYHKKTNIDFVHYNLWNN